MRLPVLFLFSIFDQVFLFFPYYKVLLFCFFHMNGAKIVYIVPLHPLQELLSFNCEANHQMSSQVPPTNYIYWATILALSQLLGFPVKSIAGFTWLVHVTYLCSVAFLRCS